MRKTSAVVVVLKEGAKEESHKKDPFAVTDDVVSNEIEWSSEFTLLYLAHLCLIKSNRQACQVGAVQILRSSKEEDPSLP